MRARPRVRRPPLDPLPLPDRPDTRRHLLETAGEVLAERGLDAATGLEICRRAHVNGAAINYYFGGVEGLYEAVLLEARSRIPSVEDLSAALAGEREAHARLRAAFALVVRVLTSPPAKGWVFRVLLRELLSPSGAFERLLLEDNALPKLRMLKSIVAEIMDLPEDHPAVTQGLISCIAPIQVMIVGGGDALRRLFPDLDLTPAAAALLVERLTAFALGGLAALARAERRDAVRRGPGADPR